MASQTNTQSKSTRMVTLPTTGGIFGDVPDPSLCEQTATMPRTRMGLAQRIHAHYGLVIAYRPDRGSWWIYQGGVWHEDGVRVGAIIRRVIRSITVHEAGWAERKNDEVVRLQARIDTLVQGGQEPSEAERIALRAARRNARAEIEKFAKTCENGMWADQVRGDLQGIVAVAEKEWDAHPFKINFPNGTINLKHRDCDGNPILMEHDPADHITMQTAVDYDPDASSDDLDSVREHMEMSGRGTWKALTRYLGYSLTGDMLAKTFLNIWSPPDAAKSTLLDVVFAAVGGQAGASYAGILDPADLSVGKAEAGRTQPGLDAMRGKRMIFVHEAQHVHLGSDLVKRWTGGDAIRTRTLNAKGGVWQPAGKFILVGNGPTPFTASDRGMVDRLYGVELQPLAQDKIDRQLRHRLLSPAGMKAALARIIKAACAWYDDTKSGKGARAALCIPAHAEKAKENALITINPLTDWIEAALSLGPEDDLAAAHGHVGRSTTAHLCEAYNHWAKRHNQPLQTPRKFGPLLTAAGLGEQVDTNFSAPARWGARSIDVKGRVRVGVRMSNRDQWERIVRGQ
jgi:phage/plasmid-associated DNA primase